MDWIDPFDICNVTRIPLSMAKNPLKVIAENLKAGGKFSSSILDYSGIKKSHSLADLYNFQHSSSLSSFQHNCIFLPWIHYRPVSKFRNDFFEIFYDNECFNRKCIKMQGLISSIQKLGYKPEDFPTRQGGHITGYYLEHRGLTKIFIVSGNHRAATLAHLKPQQQFQVIFDRKEFLKQRDLENSILSKRYDNIFSSKNVADWPSVKSGFLTEKEAITIIERYINE